jgi:hypothetical protein
MSITEVGSQRATFTSLGVQVDSLAGAYPNNVTAGDFLVCGGQAFESGPPSSITVTDTLGTTYTVLSYSPNSVERLWIAYGIAPSSGANTVTANPSGSAAYMSFSIDAFAGVNTTTPLSVDGGNSTGTGTAVADSITTATANELIIGCMGYDGGNTTVAPGGSWTEIGQYVDNATGEIHALLFGIVTTAQAYSVDWTLGASRVWQCITASFKAAPAATTLTAAAGAFTLTGNATGLVAHRRLACSAGSIAFTGKAAGLVSGTTLGTATYSLTGNAAALGAQRKLVCAAGSIALTGNAAALNRPLSAGHFSFTGIAASIRAIHRGFTDQRHALESVALVYGFTDQMQGLEAHDPVTFIYTDQQHALSIYDPTHTYTDSLSVLNAYEPEYGFTDAQQTLDAYETSYGFTDSLAVLDAYALSYGYTDASQALNAYEVWRGTLDQSYVLNAYAQAQYGYTDGLSALNAYLTSYGYTDGLSALQTPTELLRGWTDSQYALEVRALAFGYADQAHALNTYSLSYGHTDGLYALDAWQALYGFLDSLHALDARAVAYGYTDLRHALDADPIFYGWVLNAATEAASRYEGWNFNSLCEIDASRYLGASSAGIHELGGDTDAGTDIAAFVLSGLQDFKSDYQKRVTDAYVATESDGALTLKVTADGVTDSYALNESGTLKNRKVPLGKGRKGRYWQLEIDNQDGAGFTLDQVTLLAEVLSRRA